jgi:NitT/TauT family transport system ATP-binding protein
MAGAAAPSESEIAPGSLAVRLRGVTKVFDNGVVALGPLDLEVRTGEFVSLLGPSGCGKSTALRLIAGLSAPTSGAVGVSHRGGQDLAGHSIGFVFQEPTLMPWASVRENVRLPLKLARADAVQSDARVERAFGICRRFPASIVRWHEDAGIVGARAGDRSRYSADG